MNQRNVIISILVGVAILGGAAWLQAQKSSGPTIIWSAARLLEFLTPNETRTVVVTFKSKQTLNNVVVVITPSFTSAIAATPQSFARINANQNYQLSLQLRAGPTSGVKSDGTIQLKSGAGSSATYAQPLPLTIVIHGHAVPPDPGDAGNATIQGIDSDNDGVRDDVQRYIVLEQLTDGDRRQALSQAARVQQALITSPLNRPALVLIDDQRQRAHDCLEFFFGPVAARTVANALLAEVANTRSRSLAYGEASKALGARSYFLTDESQLRLSCSF